MDLADLSSVSEFTDDPAADGRPLDLLLNNAGMMNVPQHTETVDGFELQLGSNFLGPFALAVRLLPVAGGSGSSGSHDEQRHRQPGPHRLRRPAVQPQLQPHPGLRPVPAGAEPLLYAATSPDTRAGGYYGPRWAMVGPTRMISLPRSARDKTIAAQLWTEAERLTGATVTARRP